MRYRKSNLWGDGLDTITPKKYQQMEFAAQYWIHQYKWSGNAVLAAISMSGVPIQFDKFIEI